ncbi:hypothetical protein L596_005870 [Steinernema carpocapsae]|uniref:Uncharacterized protein n=1 Tax=Steinernema carpocapsae TaxID=34508 RepID=A0A4U8V0D8_STECR|nr:hypothetical protein L596_005870 [Steinernema carpocapsae]
MLRRCDFLRISTSSSHRYSQFPLPFFHFSHILIASKICIRSILSVRVVLFVFFCLCFNNCNIFQATGGDPERNVLVTRRRQSVVKINNFLGTFLKENERKQKTQATTKTAAMISCSLYRKTFFAPEKQQNSPLPPPRPPKPEKLKYKYSAVAPPIHPRKCEEVPVSASTKWKPTPFPRLSLAKVGF